MSAFSRRNAPSAIKKPSQVSLYASLGTPALSSSSSSSSSSRYPHLPLELQLEIIHLSIPTEHSYNRPERQQHLRNLSLVRRDWRQPAQAVLFQSLAFDLRHPGDKADRASNRLKERTQGLKQLGIPATRLILEWDDTDGPLVTPFLIPWRSWIVDDYRNIHELDLRFHRADDGRTTWAEENLTPMLAKLRSLSLSRGDKRSAPTLDTEVFLPAINLTRLTLSHISFITWFPASAFPHLQTLILDRLRLSTMPRRNSPFDTLLAPFPALSALALSRTDYISDLAFLQAPSTLKHLLLSHLEPTRARGMRPHVGGGGVSSVIRMGLPELVRALPDACQLESLSFLPTRHAPGISVVRQLLSDSSPGSSSTTEAVAPCLAQLKEVHFPPRQEWLGTPHPEVDEVEQEEEVLEWCERRGVKVGRWESEVVRLGWGVEDWRKEAEE
ncbi:hypothetical protein JCM11641_002079 [Rhodosporidiobolus odoratus]